MADDITKDTNAPQPDPNPEAKAKAKRAEQDQKIANDISETAEMLAVTLKDAEVGAAMAGKGYDSEAMAQGAALQAASDATFKARQKAMSGEEAASLIFTKAEKGARAYYSEFRETARVKYPASADQTALGLKGRVPDDLQKFITVVTTSYQAALAQPYTAVLSKAGMTPEQLTAQIAAAEGLEVLNGDLHIAQGAATSATAARDAAHQAMMKWVREFRRLAKVAARKQPSLKTKLKL